MLELGTVKNDRAEFEWGIFLIGALAQPWPSEPQKPYKSEGLVIQRLRKLINYDVLGTAPAWNPDKE